MKDEIFMTFHLNHRQFLLINGLLVIEITLTFVLQFIDRNKKYFQSGRPPVKKHTVLLSQ
jgi:hypothetical protein